MTQGELFYDDIDAALRATVEALGGAKRVGVLLWPAMDAISAQTQLLNAMNADKPHKLALREFWHIAKLARQRGIHTLGKFMADDLDYEFRVITREEKQAKAIENFQKFKAQAAEMARAFGLKVTE